MLLAACTSGAASPTASLAPIAPTARPAPTVEVTAAPTPTAPTTTPYAPPTGPVGTANTTVTVETFDTTALRFALSHTTMPSGMVTFVITNRCIDLCSFDLEGIKAGALLNPGQSETWTVALPAGTYRYHCDAAPTLMKGSFTVTP